MKSKDITPKTTISGGVRQPRVAPPVYRPQPLPKVLQRKVHHHVAPIPPAANPNQSIQRKVIQPKVNVPPPRPNLVAQRKATTPGPHTPPKRPQPFGPRSRVAQLTQHARVPRTQTLVKDAPGGKLAGTTFGWSSNFDVDVIGHKVVVTVRVKAAISPDLFERVWRRSVAEKWNNKFMIQANGENYPIEVNLEHVPGAEHYAITVRPEVKVSGSGSRGHFGTESMTVWGENDVFNVAHEVGHMLGNVDEYGVVKLSPTDVRDYLTTPSTGIMHRPEFDPLAHNYYLIAHYAKLEMIDKKIIKPTDTVEIKPDVVSRHGGGGDVGGQSLAAVLSARGHLRPKGAAAAAASATTTTTSPLDDDLAKKLAMRRAAIATAATTTTPPPTVSIGAATTTTPPSPLPPRALPPRPTATSPTTPTTPTTPAGTTPTITSPSLAAIAAAPPFTGPPKPLARATASTTTTTMAPTSSASPSSTPPSASASPAKTATAPAKRATRARATPPPPIPTIRFHYARVSFINDYLLNYFDFLTEEQIAFFTIHPWRTDTAISEKAMALLAKGHK